MPAPRIFYVNNGGSDANTGLTTGTPWRTVGHVNVQAFNPGDQILFQGGQSFTDTDLEVYSTGTAGLPITFSSYGTGQATLNQIYFSGYDYLTFSNVAVIYAGGLPFNGNGNNVTITGCLIDGLSDQTTGGSVQLGISAKGNNWAITNSTVQNTGLSGIEWYGDTISLTGNTVTNVGLRSPGSANAAVGYNAHGIYIGQTGFTGINATVDSNQIYNPPGSEAMMESGVSQRSRNGTVTNNTIHNCQIGIDFYESDPVGGSTVWSNNQIYNTTIVFMYVQGPTGGDYATSESFTIQNNTIGPVRAGSATINVLSSYTTGTVTISGNVAPGVPVLGMLGTAALASFELGAPVGIAVAPITASDTFTVSDTAIGVRSALPTRAASDSVTVSDTARVAASRTRAADTVTITSTATWTIPSVIVGVETLPTHATIIAYSSQATFTTIRASASLTAYSAGASIAPYSSKGELEITNDPAVVFA